MREIYRPSEAPTVPNPRRPAAQGPAAKGNTARLRISPGIEPQPAPPLPLLVPLVGGLWWVVGATALDAGAGTLVLAAGIGVTAWLAVTLRRRHSSGARVPAGVRQRILRILACAAVVSVGSGLGLGLLGSGELAVPLACAAAAFALFPLAPLLDDRSLVALGGALLVMAALGAVLALGSAGGLYPQGMVGMVAGVLFWFTAAHRGGLLAELRARLAP